MMLQVHAIINYRYLYREILFIIKISMMEYTNFLIDWVEFSRLNVVPF